MMGRLRLLLALPLALAACTVSITTMPPEQAEEICHLDRGGGYLIADARTGLGIRFGADIHPVIWPVGFSARREVLGPLVLVDRNGQDVAREGDLVGMSGGFDANGVFHVCDKTTFDVTKPDTGTSLVTWPRDIAGR